jgi:hypothetical protein
VGMVFLAGEQKEGNYQTELLVYKDEDVLF